jgi:LysM repeat protein
VATYTIKSGDTLSGIAAKNGVSVASIAAANPSIKDINKIFAGNSLTIPTALPKATTPTIQSTTAQRTADVATANKYDATVANKTAAVSGGLPAGSVANTVTPANNNKTTVPTGAGKNAVTVTSYKDNPDGTTTNTLSDGSTSIVRYVKNSDGSLTPVEVGTGNSTSAILDAEKDYSAKTKQQLADLDIQKADFDKQLNQILANNGALYSGTISSIQSTFATRRDQLAKSYQSLQGSRAKAGFQTDAFRYTPTHAEGLVTNDENNYISDLASLDGQEQSLLLQAATAKSGKDWDALSKQMDMYDKISAQKTKLLGNLLTSAQEQNKRIEDELKIQREAAKLPSGAEAATVAKSIAPSLVSQLKGMSTADSEKFLVAKAAGLKIDLDVLKSALIDQGVENLKDAKALKEKAAGSKPTEAESKKSFNVQLNAALNDKNAKVNGQPIVDMNGYMTPAGYKHLVAQAYVNGISRADFISNHAEKFYPEGIDAYGLTSKEKELLGL